MRWSSGRLRSRDFDDGRCAYRCPIRAFQTRVVRSFAAAAAAGVPSTLHAADVTLPPLK
jgi:hypothetical protein